MLVRKPAEGVISAADAVAALRLADEAAVLSVSVRARDPADALRRHSPAVIVSIGADIAVAVRMREDEAVQVVGIVFAVAEGVLLGAQRYIG